MTMAADIRCFPINDEFVAPMTHSIVGSGPLELVAPQVEVLSVANHIGLPEACLTATYALHVSTIYGRPDPVTRAGWLLFLFLLTCKRSDNVRAVREHMST